jgi:3-hydroxyacyl-CoA dehydrogenase
MDRDDMQSLLKEMVARNLEHLELSKAAAVRAISDVTSVDQLNMDPDWRVRRIDHAIEAVAEFARQQQTHKVLEALAHPGIGTGGVRNRHEQALKNGLKED